MSEQQEVVNLEEVSSAGRPYLKGQFCLRCIAAEKKTSKKGNPMIEFTWEFVSPETATTPDGKVVKVPGLQCMNWILLNEMGFPRLKALHSATQLDMKVNVSNPNVRQYLGKAVKASVTTDVQTVKDEQTGDAVLDEKGNPIVTNQYSIVRFNSPDPEHTIPADSVAF